jgi:hypothetical protein
MLNNINYSNKERSMLSLDNIPHKGGLNNTGLRLKRRSSIKSLDLIPIKKD